MKKIVVINLFLLFSFMLFAQEETAPAATPAQPAAPVVRQKMVGIIFLKKIIMLLFVL